MENNTVEYNLGTVTSILKDHGIYYVGCYYSGGGDSGAIENYIGHGLDYKEKFKEGDIEYDWNNSVELNINIPNYKEIENFLDNLFHKHLNRVEDWWNNDGGYGTLMMDVETCEFKNINNTYYTQTETFTHKGKFQED